MAITATLSNAMVALTGGAVAGAGTGADVEFLFAGTWAADDTWTVSLAQNSLLTQYGAGNVTGISPFFAFTYQNKVYLAASDTMYFCGLGDAYQWNQPGVSLEAASGNGFIEMSNNYGLSEPLAAIAVYQGQLAVFTRNTVQIWAVDPDPSLNAQQQVLIDVGTVAKETVKGLGELDVFCLSDCGIRSIRARVATNSAMVNDIGSPLDMILQPILSALPDTASSPTTASKDKACAIVEPLTHRYFCYVPGDKIYVLSYFPSAQIQAWTTYSPTWQNVLTPSYGFVALTVGQSYQYVAAGTGSQLTCGTLTLTQSGTFTATQGSAQISAGDQVSQRMAFVPQKFVAYQGRVYVRDTASNVYLYGGTNNNSYDACGAEARLPYLDMDQPATQKFFTGVDTAFQGDWGVFVGTDYTTQDFSQLVYRNSVSSFQLGKCIMSRRGTHVSLDFNEFSNGYARLASAIIHMEPNQNKV